MWHQLATLSANRRQLEEAMLLYADAIKLDERTDNGEGKAASLHQLAGFKAKQGYATGLFLLIGVVWIDKKSGGVRIG